jgi:hypothetical protein
MPASNPSWSLSGAVSCLGLETQSLVVRYVPTFHRLKASVTNSTSHHNSLKPWRRFARPKSDNPSTNATRQGSTANVRKTLKAICLVPVNNQRDGLITIPRKSLPSERKPGAKSRKRSATIAMTAKCPSILLGHGETSQDCCACSSTCRNRRRPFSDQSWYTCFAQMCRQSKEGKEEPLLSVWVESRLTSSAFHPQDFQTSSEEGCTGGQFFNLTFHSVVDLSLIHHYLVYPANSF